MTIQPLQPGDQICVFHPFTIALSPDIGSAGVVVERGQTITLTADIIEASKNRSGESWLNDVDEPAAQLVRWGSIRVGRGSFPEDEETWLPGTPEWSAAREAARQAAWQLQDGHARHDALEAVQRRFGSSVTSKVLATYRGDGSDL